MPPIAPPIIAALECVDCCSGIGMGVFDCVAIFAGFGGMEKRPK